MSVIVLQPLAQTQCINFSKLLISRSPGCNVCIRHPKSSRSYATHGSINMDFGSTDSSLLKKTTSSRPSEHKHDHVGPFQLGLSPASLRQGEKIPKWSELSTSGKGILA